MDDPFAALGLPRRFDLDAAAMNRAYLARSAALHPDMAGDSPEAARAAAALNNAKRVLDHAESRADALLILLGGPSRGDHKDLPPGFLIEIMEMREAVESAIASGDSAERAKWGAWATGRRAGYIAEVSARFAALGPAPSNAALAEMRTVLNAWRYIERLIEQLDPDYDHNRADFEQR